MFGLRRYLCTSTLLGDRQSTPLTVPQSPRLETGPPRCFVNLSVWLSVCLSVPAPWCFLLTWQWLGWFFYLECQCFSAMFMFLYWIFNIDGVYLLCIWPKTLFFFSLLLLVFFVCSNFFLRKPSLKNNRIFFVCKTKFTKNKTILNKQLCLRQRREFWQVGI